jgi:hypothetical protein
VRAVQPLVAASFALCLNSGDGCRLCLWRKQSWSVLGRHAGCSVRCMAAGTKHLRQRHWWCAPVALLAAWCLMFPQCNIQTVLRSCSVCTWMLLSSFVWVASCRYSQSQCHCTVQPVYNGIVTAPGYYDSSCSNSMCFSMHPALGDGMRWFTF